MTSRRERLEQLLGDAFRPARLDIVDESDRHKGHAGHRAGGESHFRVVMVSEAFAGMNRLARHRAVNAALAAEFSGDAMHALALTLLAPGEAGA